MLLSTVGIYYKIIDQSIRYVENFDMTQTQALNILKTGANVFLTGEPGSGKTFVTNEYVSYLKKKKIEVAVTASTGIAATHIGGTTIHSWSGIGITKNLSSWDIDRIASNEWVAKRIARTKVLIIDEISMLDGATLGGIDKVCREVRRNQNSFGGLQVVFVGDFFQLPPVSKASELVSGFAFTSNAWNDAKLLVCYLSEQHRQEDKKFSVLLSSLRRNKVSKNDVSSLRARCKQTDAAVPKDALILYSHNTDVDLINTVRLEKIFGECKTFFMSSSGKKSQVEQLKRGCLSPEKLSLKIGAAVMFTKNGKKGAYVNGTLGKIVCFDKTSGYPMVQTLDGKKITAEYDEWSIENHGKVTARILQIPLRLAWAITVHKSQGMSLDAAVVDLSKAFVEGQGYVALSRVRTLDGLFLLGWNEMALTVHEDVLAQDETFREQSLDAESVFKTVGKKELSKMHSDFVRACT